MILWHNPRCSKSRQTLTLLENHGYQPRIRPYLNDPPSQSDIRDVVSMLGVKPIAMMRRKEKRFAELGLAADSPDETLIAAMAENPILIERPILIMDGKAAIGRPPEAVLTILPEE